MSSDLKDLVQRGMSRRDFLAYTSAIGVSTAAASAIFAGSARADTPKKGGRLRLGVAESSTNENLDPASFNTFMSYLVSNGVLRNCLVEIDAKSEPTPELAESWDVSKDAVTWTFKLRPGVEFHNGKTLDADDVIFSMNRHRGDTKSQGKSLMDNVTDIKAADKNTVVFTLKGGNVDFPYILSDPRTQIVPANTADFNAGIGTGGYRLKEYSPGVKALSERNANYWKDGRAHFDEVEVLGINDATARLAALQSGGVDVINRPDRRLYSRISAMNGVKGVETVGGLHFTMAMRTDTDPFTNNDLRLALKYALDREAMLKTILDGHGMIGNDQPISKLNRFYDASLEQHSYDPDKAKFHLKKANVSDATFQLVTSTACLDGSNDMAALYKEQAAKAGINIDVQNYPANGFWSDAWMKKPWFFSYWFGRPSEDWIFTLTYSKDSAQNETFWKNDRFNELLVGARAEFDRAKRKDMYGEMQKIVHEEGGAVVPLFVNDLMVHKESLQHDTVAGNLELDGLKLPERWWFA